MAPSRIADSFELKLCLNPEGSPPLGSPPIGSPPYSTVDGLCEFWPSQHDLEGVSVRAFVHLLSELQVSTIGPFLTLDQLQELVRSLAQPSSPPGSPPSGPPYIVAASDEWHFVRAAFRTWITEVRPFIAASQGAGPCCPSPEKCVLLAEITISLNSNWTASAITVDDSQRPFLLSTRLLQELSLDQAAASSAAGNYQAVAAGQFDLTGNSIGPAYNGLKATLTAAPGTYLLTFSGYQQPKANSRFTYLVKGTIQDAPGLATRGTFEFDSFTTNGIQVNVLDITAAKLPATSGFMVEISRIGVTS
jgi:hypothetical protein